MFNRLKSVLRKEFPNAQPGSKEQNDPYKVVIHQFLLSKQHFAPKLKSYDISNFFTQISKRSLKQCLGLVNLPQAESKTG
jgi:hypothetical protein